MLLHTKDGERLPISLTLQSSSRLSPHLSGSEGDERMPLVKTSHVLQLACLQTPIMGSVSLWGTLNTFPLIEPEKPVACESQLEVQCPFLTDSAG